MSAKRLLDLFALASTTKSVLTQHIRLRANQLDVYSRTSSIIKPLRGRIPRNPSAATTGRGGIQAQADRDVETEKKKQNIPQAEDAGARSATLEPQGRPPTAKTTSTVTTTSATIPPPTSEPESATSSSKVTDPDIFILRSARGSSALLSRIRKQKEEERKLSEGGREKDQRPLPMLRNNMAFFDARKESPETTASGENPLTSSEKGKLKAVPEEPPIGAPDIAIPGEPPAIDPEVETPPTRKKFIDETAPIHQINEPPSLPPDEAVTITTTPTPPLTQSEIIPDDSLSSPPSRTTALDPSSSATFTTADLDAALQSPNTDIPNSEQSHLNAQLDNSGLAASPSGHIMTASRVPASRFSRALHYTGLGIGMTFGAITEGIKRAATGGGGGRGGGNSIMLSEANVERLVRKLSRMRGAALKLGQMLSLQDSKLLPPALQQVLSRVQDSADYMPSSQLQPILQHTLGPDWRSLFQSFNETPIAAASIGQVHSATLAPHLIPPSDPRNPNHPNHIPAPYPVAVKIQYPNIKSSINSDLNNLSMLLTASRLLPKGLYLDKTIANARTELAWECDYLREAASMTTFQSLLPPDDPTHPFTIPYAIPEASGEHVLTMTMMPGTPVTRIPDLAQSERDFIGSSVLKLSLMEIARFKFMQTDPNWSNFLWNRKTGKIELLDFGACRAYPAEFVEQYVSLLRAGRRRDFEGCVKLSQDLGYLTGMEGKQMVEAHVQSIFILAEPFMREHASKEEGGLYDFSRQTVTDRVRKLIPLMVRERLTPPPEETYSLHRKLSGAYLLCAKLGSRVDGEGMFAEVVGL